MDKKELAEKINKLKKEKNAIILAHCYQNIEIDLVADFVGDSLGLSQLAAKTNADKIIFAGVYFMAETAKILNPAKKVYLPNISGCDMADMINLEQIRNFKAKNPNIPTVCYINSTAAVKSECDICCTSSNAVEVVKSLSSSEVLFVPDKYLASWVEKNLPNVKITAYQGYCPTHFKISANDILTKKKENPNAIVLSHPACRNEVVELSDFVGSTTQMMAYCKKSSEKEFIVATELGVVQRLQRDYPNKKIIPISKEIFCPSMKENTLEDILYTLENENNEITVDDEVAKKAINCIDRMLKI